MDPIANLLITIKNNMAVGRNQIRVPYSKLKAAILEILNKKGIVESFKISRDGNRQFIDLVIAMRDSNKSYHMCRISKPGRRVFVKSKDIRSPLAGLGFVIISTPRGLLTGSEAKKIGLGGELICEVW